MTETLLKLMTIIIGICYCFYKICEVILVFIKAKYNYTEKNLDKPKIDIKVGDRIDDN